MKEAGADHVMLQECMMPNWNRGSKDEASIITIDGKKSNRSLDVVALGNSLGTDGKPVIAEVVTI
ncbi:hypothetical protein ACSTIM_23400, partial [Vibrio parahaemolyticus]